jgi:N-carbamoylputrescine amidase
MSEVSVAVLQCELAGDRATNVSKVESFVRKAAAQGAQIILPSELFETPYFCRVESESLFSLAAPVEGHPTLARFSALARELGVVIPVSFFERDRQEFYNSLIVFDADGSALPIYRKSHIPDGPGYEEKFYFRPGNTGFRVWQTRFGALGVGICWDQWFPECARAMALQGADILLYPTAIGSEPHDPGLDTRDPWQRAMIGHSVSNVIPVCAANRVGLEDNQRFYGSSFCANERGDKISELSRDEEGIAQATFDFETIRLHRAAWGFFRDRRTDLYENLL